MLTFRTTTAWHLRGEDLKYMTDALTAAGFVEVDGKWKKSVQGGGAGFEMER